MNLAEALGDTWAGVYYGLLVSNGVVAITCLAAGPRPWSRRLCAITSQVNILLLLGGVAAGKAGAIDNAAFGLYLALLLPVLGQLLALLAISRWRLGNRRFPWVPG